MHGKQGRIDLVCEYLAKRFFTHADRLHARLYRQSTLVKKTRITGESLLGVTAIDGALLLDTQGYCHAVGVILDGKPTKGDPSKGARHNSALKYVDSHKKRCMVIVVSEDGPVTILPDS